MGKISTYLIDAKPTLKDKVIGSDVDDSSVTKNYLLSDIIGLVETPNLQEVLDSGNTATQDIILKGQVDTETLNVGVSATFPGTVEFTNNVLFDVGDVELQGGVKDSTASYGTAGQFLQTDGSLVTWVTPPPFPADLQSVLDTGNTATEDINLTGDINLQGNLTQSIGNTQVIEFVAKGKSIFELEAEFQDDIILEGALLDAGANPGTTDQILISTGSSVKWADNVVVTEPTFVEVLSAAEYLKQVPTGQNTPLQVIFGAAQSNVYVDLTSTGEMTFAADGTYLVNFDGNAMISTSPSGPATMFYRILIDGNQLGETKVVELTEPNIITPININQPITVTTGQVLSFEIMRDANASNDGNLNERVVAGGIWTTSPSAAISIWKLE